MKNMKEKKVFGDCWWVEKTSSGKWALIETEINVGDNKLSDLTDEQLKNSNIEIYDTQEEANSERLKCVLNQL